MQRLPDVVNMEDFLQKDLASPSGGGGWAGRLEQLHAEKEALQRQLQALQAEGGGASATADGQDLQREKKELLSEVAKLRDVAQSASKVGRRRRGRGSILMGFFSTSSKLSALV